MSDAMKYAHYAKRVKIFEGFSAEEVAEVLHRSDKLYFHAGQTIFHRGQLGSTIFIVLRGIVDIESEGCTLAKCREGDAFGEMSVLNHSPHCASAAAVTDVKLCAIDEDHINALLGGHVAARFLLNIIHVLSSRLERANSLIAQQNKTAGYPLSGSPAIRSELAHRATKQD